LMLMTQAIITLTNPSPEMHLKEMLLLCCLRLQTPTQRSKNCGRERVTENLPRIYSMILETKSVLRS